MVRVNSLTLSFSLSLSLKHTHNHTNRLILRTNHVHHLSHVCVWTRGGKSKGTAPDLSQSSLDIGLEFSTTEVSSSNVLDKENEYVEPVPTDATPRASHKKS